MKTHLHINCLSSTNTYLKDLVSKHPIDSLQDFLPPYFAITADKQQKGRGQQNKSWESEAGKNLLMSLLLYPRVHPSKQFNISQYISIAIADFIKEKVNNNVYIKWPNDIYVGDNKIVGILIEHFIRGETINYTIAGIGININQTVFSSSLPNPTSIYLETGQEHNLIDCMKTIIEKIKQTETLPDTIRTSYYENYLYKKDVFSDFIIPKISNIPLSLKIKGVNEIGLLELVDINNVSYCCAFNEIVYVRDEQLNNAIF